MRTVEIHTMDDVISTFPERDQRIYTMRKNQETLADIGSHMLLTRERVRQILGGIERRLDYLLERKTVVCPKCEDGIVKMGYNGWMCPTCDLCPSCAKHRPWSTKGDRLCFGCDRRSRPSFARYHWLQSLPNGNYSVGGVEMDEAGVRSVGSHCMECGTGTSFSATRRCHACSTARKEGMAARKSKTKSEIMSTVGDGEMTVKEVSLALGEKYGRTFQVMQFLVGDGALSMGPDKKYRRVHG